jgi:serine/threonine protein kinase
VKYAAYEDGDLTEQLRGRVLLGMELCECSLHQVVSERKLQVPLLQQLRIVRELSEAVDFIHRRGGVLHRDIRPKNVLFSQVAQGRPDFEGTVKLADFGLAKDVGVREMNQSVTNSSYSSQYGKEPASAGYYAKEVWFEDKIKDKTDVFSWAACSSTSSRMANDHLTSRANLATSFTPFTTFVIIIARICGSLSSRIPRCTILSPP